MASPFLDRDLDHYPESPFRPPSSKTVQDIYVPYRPSSSKANHNAYDTPAIPLIVEMKGDDLVDRPSQECSDHEDFDVRNQRDAVGVILYNSNQGRGDFHVELPITRQQLKE